MKDYVRRIMAEKNLSARDVAKRSGGKIGHATVSKIMLGKAKRPSLPILRGLAKGIDEPEKDVIRVAGNLPEEEEWTPKSLAKAITKIVSSSELTKAVKLLLRHSSKEVGAALPVLEKALAGKKKS